MQQRTDATGAVLEQVCVLPFRLLPLDGPQTGSLASHLSVKLGSGLGGVMVKMQRRRLVPPFCLIDSGGYLTWCVCRSGDRVS